MIQIKKIELLEIIEAAFAKERSASAQMIEEIVRKAIVSAKASISRTVTVKEAGRILNMSDSGIRRMIEDGRLCAKKGKGYTRITTKSIEEL